MPIQTHPDPVREWLLNATTGLQSEEGSPRFGRGTRQPRQQSRHRTLGDLNAQLPELAVDARGAPKRVGACHVGEDSVARDVPPTW